MKYMICPNLNCRCDDEACDHHGKHHHNNDCSYDDFFTYCPSCIEVEEFIEADEMEI